MKDTLSKIVMGLILILFLLPLHLYGEEIAPPLTVKAFDTPNDGGGSITITWELSPDDSILSGYEIWRSDHPDTGYTMVGYVGRGIKSYKDDKKVTNGVSYHYRVRGRTRGYEISAFTEAPSPVVSSYQWYHKGKTNVLVAIIVFTGFLLYFIFSARKGKPLFIRQIAGLDALDEAVGRATEMGKPLLYVPGLGYLDEIATIASMNILGRIAKKVAQYNTPIMVPVADPIEMMVARQVVKQGYLEAGRPDAYKEESVFFITTSQFAFAAAVAGIMVREKPATNLFLGWFRAESLLLAETGNMTGAIQIAGTDQVSQLPFFVTACDYTIIGEELYAASAYLAKDPVLLGSIKAQDWLKFIILVFIVTGTVTTLLGIPFIRILFNI